MRQCFQSKEEGQDQDSIQSSTILDARHRMGKWKNTTKRHTHERQKVSAFPAGDHKAVRHRQDNVTNTNKNDPQKKNRHVTNSKKITETENYM